MLQCIKFVKIHCKLNYMCGSKSYMYTCMCLYNQNFVHVLHPQFYFILIISYLSCSELVRIFSACKHRNQKLICCNSHLGFPKDCTLGYYLYIVLPKTDLVISTQANELSRLKSITSSPAETVLRISDASKSKPISHSSLI